MIDANDAWEVPATGEILVRNGADGRLKRTGAASALAVGTYVHAMTVIEQGAARSAALYVEMFWQEVNAVAHILDLFMADIDGIVAEHYADAPDELAAIVARIEELAVLPDGTAFDAPRAWSAVQALYQLTSERMDPLADDAGRCLSELKERWRRLHDRRIDRVAGLLDAVVRRGGEEAIEAAMRKLNAPVFADRYAQFDVSLRPWDEILPELVEVTFESGRGHLTGPGRTGTATFEEQEDCYVWTWDPCGTCGRLLRGDEIEHTPPRDEPPFGWAGLSSAYSWTRGEPGYTPYAVQSCVKLEQMSIARFGYPIRVVDCPTTLTPRDTPCVRRVFKDPTTVPDRYYERVGMQRPESFGSARDVRPGSTATHPGATE